MASEIDGGVKKVQSTMYGKLAYTKKFQEDGKFHYLVTFQVTVWKNGGSEFGGYGEQTESFCYNCMRLIANNRHMVRDESHTPCALCGRVD